MNIGILIIGIGAILLGVYGFYKAIKKSKQKKHEETTKTS